MKIYCVIPEASDNGVGYYRMWLPLREAEKNGEIELRCNHFTWGDRVDAEGKKLAEPTTEEFQTNGSWADLVYWARNDVPNYIAMGGGLRDFTHHPCMIDIDDNVQATRPYNPGYRSFFPNSPFMKYNIKSLGIYNGITLSTQDLYDFYSNYTEKEKMGWQTLTGYNILILTFILKPIQSNLYPPIGIPITLGDLEKLFQRLPIY